MMDEYEVIVYLLEFAEDAVKACDLDEGSYSKVPLFDVRWSAESILERAGYVKNTVDGTWSKL